MNTTKKSVKLKKISNKTTTGAKPKSLHIDSAVESSASLSTKADIRQSISELDKSVRWMKGHVSIIDFVLTLTAFFAISYLSRNIRTVCLWLIFIILNFIVLYRRQSNRILVTLMKIEKHLAGAEKKSK